MRARIHHAVLLCAVVFSGCFMQGSYNANEWINGLEKGMTRDEVEAAKPDQVTIHWDHPIVTDSVTTEYDVTYKDRMDFAPTPNFLVFKSGAFAFYSGRN